MKFFGERYLEGCRSGWKEVIRDIRFASFDMANDMYAAIADMADASREELAFLACNDRFFLLTALLRRPDANKPWLYDRCREVEDEPDGYIDLWAREHYKSTIITFAGVIQEIIRDPEITIGIFSVTKEVSRPFVSQVKEELEGNELLTAIFEDVFWSNPRREAPSWSVDGGLVVKRKGNPKEATVEGHGLIDAMPTGRHFRLRVYDDVINEKYTSPDMIKKSMQRFELSTNLGGGERRSQIVGTRYHFGDSYGIMMERGIVKVRIYPATDNGKLNGKPVFLSPEDWEKRKREQRGTIAAQMLQNPLAGEANSFDGRWLRPYYVRPARMNVYIMVDPSKGRSATSDRTAIAVIGIDANDNRYLLDGYCHRMKLSERWEALKQLWRKWSKAIGVVTCNIGYEQYGLLTDIEYFEERNLAEKTDMPAFIELNWSRDAQTQSKKDRVERLEPYFRNSKFWIPARLYDTGMGGLCTWEWHEQQSRIISIKAPEPSADNPYVHLTREERAALARGEPWRLMEPIRRTDEDRAPYDVLKVFFEEFQFFPFSPRDDFIDALSRVQDMEPTGPMSYDAKLLQPMEHAE